MTLALSQLGPTESLTEAVSLDKLHARKACECSREIAREAIATSLQGGMVWGSIVPHRYHVYYFIGTRG